MYASFSLPARYQTSGAPQLYCCGFDPPASFLLSRLAFFSTQVTSFAISFSWLWIVSSASFFDSTLSAPLRPARAMSIAPWWCGIIAQIQATSASFAIIPVIIGPFMLIIAWCRPFCVSVI